MKEPRGLSNNARNQVRIESCKGPTLGASLGLETVSEPLLLQVSGMDHVNNNELKV